MSSPKTFKDNPLSYGSLEAARALLKNNPHVREKLLDCLMSIEAELQTQNGQNIREDLTGPITDLLIQPGELMQREVEGGLRFNFRYSSKIARDFLLARGRSLDHVWEPQTTRSVVALSQGQKNVLIGGAYIGDHALYAAKALSSGGQCHCFELSDESLDLLRRNISDNGVQNIIVNQQALWSVDGTAIALTGEDSHASPQVAQTAGQQTFVSRTIDSYAAERNLDQLALVMLDIEGGEFDAIKGAREVMSRPSDRAPALICEIHRAYVDWTDGLRSTPLCAEMISHGYEVFCIRDYQGNEVVHPKHVELVDIDSAVIDGPPHGFNLLAVKARSRLSADVFRFVRGVSPKLLKHRDPQIYAPLTA